MHIGIVGLGKMGTGMRARLREHGHHVTGFDIVNDDRDVDSLDDLVDALADEPRRVVWLMVPAGEPTNDTVDLLAEMLTEGDLVVDGGNSNYNDSLEHADLLAEQGVGFVDAGISGGVWGREDGYAIMVGGDDEDVEDLAPVLEALAPDGEFFHVGEVGAGHFTKMVHNGVEYALMQAYGEGFEILSASDLDIDVPTAFASWQRGSVVRSWLLDLLVDALDDDPELAGVAGYAEDSGEGRWTVQEAIELAVPAPAISAALFARFASRQEDAAAMKVVATLRRQFGGHAVTPADE
jgi:6-phosphogluconate dehydrogenase